MAITYEKLLQAARDNQNRLLQTNAGRATFPLHVVGREIFATPTSSGKTRPLTQGIDDVIDYFNKTQSFTSTDYQDITYNVAYVLRLIKLAQMQS